MPPLEAEDDEDTGAQYAHDRLDFWYHGRGRTDDHLEVRGTGKKGRMQFAPDFCVIYFVFSTMHLLLQLLTADSEPGTGLGLRHSANCSFRVVSWRHHEFRRRERILPTA